MIFTDTSGIRIDKINSSGETPTHTHARAYGLLPTAQCIVEQLGKTHAHPRNEEIDRWLDAYTGESFRSMDCDGITTMEEFSTYTPYGAGAVSCKTLFEFFKANCITHVEPNSVFATSGYAGCVDVIAMNHDQTFLINIKTTDDLSSVPEGWLYLAGAYSHHPIVEDSGKSPIMIQAVFDRDSGEAYQGGEMLDGLIQYSPISINRAVKSFNLLYELWCLRNAYDPRSFKRYNYKSVFDQFPTLEVAQTK